MSDNFFFSDEIDDQSNTPDPIYGDVEVLPEDGVEEETPSQVVDVIDPGEEDNNCFRIPKIDLNFKPTLPSINLGFGLPNFSVSIPNFCKNSHEPIVKDSPISNKIASGIAPPADQQTKTDKTDPKNKPVESSSETLISTPTPPQQVSAEIVNVIPKVQKDVSDTFINNTLISMSTGMSNIFGFLAAATEKVAALGDSGLQQLAAQLILLAGAAEEKGALNTKTEAGKAALAVANKVASATEVRQVPAGPIPLNSSRDPVLGLATASNMRSDWPTDGFLKTPIQNITNTVNNAIDAAACSVSLCWAGPAVRAFGESIRQALSGFGRDAMAFQLDGILRLGALNPTSLISGFQRTLHNWRFDCAHKDDPKTFPGSSQEPIKTLSDVEAKTVSAESRVAGPKDSLFSQAFDDGESNPVLTDIPANYAKKLGSPNADVIDRYVNDPDEKYDSLTPALPSLFRAGSSKLGNLERGLFGLQEASKYVLSLSEETKSRLFKEFNSQIGPVLPFITEVINVVSTTDSASKLNVNTFATKAVNNKLSVYDQDRLVTLATVWDGIEIDRSLIQDTEIAKPAVDGILNPREFLNGNMLADMVSESPSYLNTFGGEGGSDTIYQASQYAAGLRMLKVLNSDKSDEAARAQVVGIAKDASVFSDEIESYSPVGEYISSVADISTENPRVTYTEMVRNNVPTTIRAAGKFSQNTVKNLNTSAVISMDARGIKPDDLKRGANDIAVKERSSDTQSYVSGALKRQAEATKKILTVSLVNMNAAASLISKNKISTKPDERKKFVEKLLEETSRALAPATLDKITGVQLNQQFESTVNTAKFIVNHAGSSHMIEAPVVRSTGRVNIMQGESALVEGNAVDIRSRWIYGLAEQSIGWLTEDYHVSASGKSVNTAKEIYSLGQIGTVIGDKEKLTIGCGSTGSNLAQVKLGSNGLSLYSPKEVIINVGSCSMKVTGSRIDLNPTIPANIVPDAVDYNYAPPPKLDKQKDLDSGAQKQERGVNPPPVAPYLA